MHTLHTKCCELKIFYIHLNKQRPSMRKIVLTCLASLFLQSVEAQKNHGYPITPIPFTQVKVVNNTFWGSDWKPAEKQPFPLHLTNVKKQDVMKTSKKRLIPVRIIR